MRHSFLLGLIFIAGCSEIPETETSEKQSKNQFVEEKNEIKIKTPRELDLDTVRFINLPFKMDCGINEKVEYPEFTIPSLLNKDIFVVGRVNQNINPKLTVLLTYFRSEIKYPFFYSFNSKGQIIDSIALHNGNCASDPWLSETCWSVISIDMEVEMYDSLEYYSFDGENQTLDSIRTIKQLIRMQSNGEFELKTNSK